MDMVWFLFYLCDSKIKERCCFLYRSVMYMLSQIQSLKVVAKSQHTEILKSIYYLTGSLDMVVVKVLLNLTADLMILTATLIKTANHRWN